MWVEDLNSFKFKLGLAGTGGILLILLNLFFQAIFLNSKYDQVSNNNQRIVEELQNKTISKNFPGCENPPAYQYHVVVTTSSWHGTCAYQDWQTSVLYERVKELQQNNCSAIGGFTRLLVGDQRPMHKIFGMDVIPTLLIPEDYSREFQTPSYVVGARAMAMNYFAEKILPSLKEEYVLLVDPDMFFIFRNLNMLREMDERDVFFWYFFTKTCFKKI